MQLLVYKAHETDAGKHKPGTFLNLILWLLHVQVAQSRDQSNESIHLYPSSVSVAF